MIRIDLRSVAVFVAALASSFACAGTLLWLEDGAGSARAADAAPVVAPWIDGHYWADAAVEGRPARMLVDTGASFVTLGRSDAARLGLDVSPEAFTRTVTTAGGPVKAAPVVLSSLSVGSVRVARVEALVVDRDLPASLLGMSYLGRLTAFEARPEGLVLKG